MNNLGNYLALKIIVCGSIAVGLTLYKVGKFVVSKTIAK